MYDEGNERKLNVQNCNYSLVAEFGRLYKNNSQNSEIHLTYSTRAKSYHHIKANKKTKRGFPQKMGYRRHIDRGRKRPNITVKNMWTQNDYLKMNAKKEKPHSSTRNYTK